jgi:SAM-dependent methyltransferase
VLQVVADLSKKRLSELRVLDLACYEGTYAIEFALHGAEVVGIEGREENIARARERIRAHRLDRVELVRGDVRDLDQTNVGTFDAVLCLGLLYHLDFPEVIRFLESVAKVCEHLAVFDTHVNLGLSRTFRDGPRAYRGRRYVEHSTHATAAEREQSRWASLDNSSSVWFTRPSLINALMDVGFTSVYECEVPPEQMKPLDRRTFVAVNGNRARLRSASESPGRGWERVPERRSRDLLLRNHAPGMNLLKQVMLDVERLRARRNSRSYGPRSHGRRR